MDMIGIGNALVDIEYRISDAVLQKMALTRGNMTLADSDTQQALLASLAQQNISISKQAGGGSAANSLACFSALGGKSFYNCSVGKDSYGEFYLQDLARFGVQTDADFAIGEHDVTGTCIALISDDGERTMQTHLGISAAISHHNVNYERLPCAKWLYLEGYLAMSPSVSDAITRLRQQAGVHGVKIALSFADPAVVTFAKDGLMTMIGNGVDVIFCNLQEAQIFSHKKQHKACVKALLEYAPLVVVTNGANPTLVGQRTNDEIALYEIASQSIKAIDTTGAGDNFAGAFMYGLCEYYSIEKCGELASLIASQVATQFGARLDKQDYMAIKQRVLGY